MKFVLWFDSLIPLIQVWLPLLFIAAGLWFTLRKVKKHKNIQRWITAKEVGELYSPAYALLLSKRSKKIENDDFRRELGSLLIKQWHLATDLKIRTEMKEWLRNNRDPEGYRLQMLLESKIEDYYKKKPFNKTFI